MAKKDIIKRKKGEIIHDAQIEGQPKYNIDYKPIVIVIACIAIILILLFF